MSRPRSPHYSHRMSPRRYEDRGDSRSHRFPWDNPTFDPERVLADLDKLPWKEVPEDLRALRENLMEEIHPGAQRRPPHSPSRHHHRPGHHHRHLPPEEYHTQHRSLSPPPHEPGYGKLGRFSPKPLLRDCDGSSGGGKGRLREESGRFEERERPRRSPQRLSRERLPSLGHAHQAHPQHRDPSVGWGREEQTRGQGRSRERFHNQGRGDGRAGGGESCGPVEDRRREDLQRDRSPHSDRYERESEFRERHRSLERGPGERGAEPWGGPSQRGGRARGPLIVEHGHGMMDDSGGPPRREPFEDRRDRGASRDRPRYGATSSQERFRKSNIREEAIGHPAVLDGRGDLGHEARRSSSLHPEGRNSPIHRDARRSPIYHEGTSSMGLPPGREGPVDHRGRSSQAHRGRGKPSRGGRMDSMPFRKQPHPQPFPHGQLQSAQQHQRQSVLPREPDWNVDPREEEPPGWVQEPHSAPQWEKDRPRGRGRPHPGRRMDPAMPRGREQNPHWNETQTLNVEETLTIKVDMNCRVGQNSQLCYSSDRQLSLDLVNVGRQRLDFLPMLEHSGTYRENAMHSGTFAQEIISLVHKVKEHYFQGDGITLNQRFSGPQKGGLPVEEDEEEEELEEEERPTLNRRFNMNMKMMVTDTRPLFSGVGRVQPHQRQQLMNDPGDLRHDLERRRQERLEGVKVTILGGNLSQRPPGPGREQNEEYLSEEEEMMPMEEEEDGGSSGWSGEQDQGRRWDRHMGQRGGALFSSNTSAMRRNYRPQNRSGNHPGNRPGNRPENRPGNRHNTNGPDW